MKHYIEKITEEILLSNNIKNCVFIGENGFNPKMIINYLDGKEAIIDGDEDIKKFLQVLIFT